MNKENNMNRQRFSGFGARTRLNVLAGKNIRKGDDGKDIFDDYFTDDDGDSDGSDTSEFEPSCVTEKNSNVILNNSTSDSSKSKTPCISRKDSSLVNDNVVASNSKSKASDVTQGHSSVTQNNEQDILPMNSSNSLAETIGNKHPDSLSPDVHVNTNSFFSSTCTDKNILSSSIRIGKKSLLPKEVPVRLTHTFTKPTRKTQSTAELDSMLNMYDEYDLQLMSKTGVSEDNTEETSEQEDDDSDHQGSNGEKRTSRSLLHNKNASPVSSKSFAFDGNKSGKNRVINKKALVPSIPDSTDVIDNFPNDGEVNTNGKSEEKNAEINIRRKRSLVLQSDNLNVTFSTEPKETETSRVGKSCNKSPEKSFLRCTRMSNSNRGDNNKSSLGQNEKGKTGTQTDGIEINGNVIASSETQTDKNEHAKSAHHNKNKKIIQSPRKRQCNATFSISPNKNKSNKNTDALNSKDNPPLTSTAENNAIIGLHQAVVNSTFCKSSSDRNEGEQIVYTPNRNRKTKLINSDDDTVSISATYGSPDTDNQSPTTGNRNSSSHQSAISTLKEPSPSTNREPPLDLARTFAPKKQADKSNNALNRGKQSKNILPSDSPLKKSLKSRKKDSSKLVVNSSTNPDVMDADKSNDARKINKKRKTLLPLNSRSKNKKENSNKLVTTHQNINQADNDVLAENSEAAFTASQNSAPENQGDKSYNTRQIRKSQRIKLPPPVSTLKSNLRSSRNPSKLVGNSSPTHQTISQPDNILKETYAATFTNSQTSTPKKRANELDNGRLIKKQRLNLSPPISPLKSSRRSVKRKLVENSSPHEMDQEVCNNDVIEEETNKLENSNILQNIQINDNDICDDEIHEENSEAEGEKQKEKNERQKQKDTNERQKQKEENERQKQKDKNEREKQKEENERQKQKDKNEREKQKDKREKQKEKNEREKQKKKRKREKPAETEDSYTNKELGETSGGKISKTKERKKVVRNGSLLDQGSSKDLPSSPKQQNYLSKKKRKRDKRREHEVTAERKSCRQRFLPLEFWRNQRAVYIEKDGEMQLEIDSGYKIDDSSTQAILAKQKREAAHKQKISKPKETKLILPEKNCSQSMELVKKYVHRVWENTNAENGFDCDLELTTLFETNKAAFGYLRIEKGKEKPKQLMKDDDLFLLIVKGKAEITIQENTHILSERDVFIVPRGIFYSVKNLGRLKLLIAYVVGKFRFLESAV